MANVTTVKHLESDSITIPLPIFLMVVGAIILCCVCCIGYCIGRFALVLNMSSDLTSELQKKVQLNINEICVLLFLGIFGSIGNVIILRCLFSSNPCDWSKWSEEGPSFSKICVWSAYVLDALALLFVVLYVWKNIYYKCLRKQPEPVAVGEHPYQELASK